MLLSYEGVNLIGEKYEGSGGALHDNVIETAISGEQLNEVLLLEDVLLLGSTLLLMTSL